AQASGQQMQQSVTAVGGQIGLLHQHPRQEGVQVGVKIERLDAQVLQKVTSPAHSGHVYQPGQLERILKATGQEEIAQRPQPAIHRAKRQAADGTRQGGIVGKNLDLLAFKPAEKARQV